MYNFIHQTTNPSNIKMSLRRTLSKRFFTQEPSLPPNPFTTTYKQSLPIPPPATTRFFRRFLQRRFINNNYSYPDTFPTFLTLPLGDKLREKLKSLNSTGNHRVSPPPVVPEDGKFSVSVTDVKRVMRFVQLEKVKDSLRNIPANAIPYGEFVGICGEACGDGKMGVEFAKVLDECGNVIVLGGVVFLRPDQVVKSMENIISQTIAMPNDPRRKELDSLQNIKALIDKKAQAQVRGELYCGLGFLLAQTVGFMRLTFWELSWDVMEPICFFVTSLHFALAYAFFLRTSKEPTFEGYFQRRFRIKQKKLMQIHNFDVERYNQLCQAFYPNYCNQTFKKIVI